MNKIVLIGPPGSGKSTVGRALARELNEDFVDSDAKIVERDGRPIAEIFEESGEEYFRSLEREIVLHEIQSPHGILALGGGSIVNPDIQDAIKNSGATVIYLMVGLNNVLARISGRSDRPLLTEDPQQRWLKLLESRAAIYEELSTFSVLTDNKKAPEVAAELIEWLGIRHG